MIAFTFVDNPSRDASNMPPPLQVKKELDDIPSTSHQEQPQLQMPHQPQTIAVSVPPNQLTHTIVDGSPNMNSQPIHHIVTQHEPSELPTPMQIAQVQGLGPGTHQLTLSSLNQVNFNSLATVSFHSR